jgi:hypothetical protein
MLQEVTVYIIIAVSLAYVANRIYGSIKKKQACDKCSLMEAVNKGK